MTDILAIAVIAGGFIALVFLAALLYLGLRFWLLCGSFASAHRVIDARRAMDAEQLDELMRAGMREAKARGMLREDLQ